jgi:hypothetical protein
MNTQTNFKPLKTTKLSHLKLYKLELRIANGSYKAELFPNNERINLEDVFFYLANINSAQ